MQDEATIKSLKTEAKSHGPIERTHTDLLPVFNGTHAYNDFPTFRGFSWKEHDYHYRHVWAAPFGVVQHH